MRAPERDGVVNASQEAYLGLLETALVYARAVVRDANGADARRAEADLAWAARRFVATTIDAFDGLIVLLHGEDRIDGGRDDD